MHSTASTHYVGERLSAKGQRFTVRYIGPVAGTDGIWLGVEWDDERRGKHDGSHGDPLVSYFTCRSSSSNPASFIRPESRLDPLTSFAQALEDKYCTAPVLCGHHEHIEPTILISGKPVEERGFDKISKQFSNVRDLRTIVLSNARIKHLLLTGESCDQDEDNLKCNIEPASLLVEDLDLSENLLQEWPSTLNFLSSLPRLRNLKLSGNRFSNARLHQTVDLPNLEQVAELELDRCFLDLRENLCARANHLTKIEPEINLKHLAHLDLSWNDLPELLDISALAGLTNLQTLSFRGNKIRILHIHGPARKAVGSLRLRHLDLGSNPIDSWTDFEKCLSLWHSLESLYIRETPLSTEPSARLHMIARVGPLKELNHTAISKAERKNAELYHLSQIAGELKTVAEAEHPAYLQRYPRWSELCAIHGQPQISYQKSSEADLSPSALRFTVVQFYFHLCESCSKDRGLPFRTLKRSLPISISIQKLIGIVASAFHFRTIATQLILETDEYVPVVTDYSGWDVSADDSESEEIGLDPVRHDTKPVMRRRDLILQPSFKSISDELPMDFDTQATVINIRVRHRSE